MNQQEAINIRQKVMAELAPLMGGDLTAEEKDELPFPDCWGVEITSSHPFFNHAAIAKLASIVAPHSVFFVGGTEKLTVTIN